jgi:cytochrome d ubiquinol oxidase subunit I
MVTTFVLAPVQPAYLREARQMQALSFSVHIPPVCFGIALPAMILFAEWLYLRSGDELYRTLARRWTKVMVALFAAGAITGTILSFEMGLLWPNFTATFGSVSGWALLSKGSHSSSSRSSWGSTSTGGAAPRLGHISSAGSRWRSPALPGRSW